jgi:hypothetical protein
MGKEVAEDKEVKPKGLSRAEIKKAVSESLAAHFSENKSLDEKTRHETKLLVMAETRAAFQELTRKLKSMVDDDIVEIGKAKIKDKLKDTHKK